jgi:hypothetical protein
MNGAHRTKHLKYTILLTIVVFFAGTRPILTEKVELKTQKKLRFLGGGGDSHHEEDTSYNCPSNCIKCGFAPPHTCSSCLFLYFPDKKANLCKKCPIERCNLCKSETSCEKCRVGHEPNSTDGGKTCVVSLWFKLLSYILLWSSMAIALMFFVSCCYFISVGPTKAPGNHGDHNHGHDDHGHSGHGHDSHKKDHHSEEKDTERGSDMINLGAEDLNADI